MTDPIHIGPRPRGDWTTLTRGVHLSGGQHELATVLMAWQFALPFWSSFTSLTAAGLRGWWLPPLPQSLPLFVASGSSSRMSRPGLQVCRHTQLPPWELVRRVRVPSAAETVLACARDLGLIDVVLIGDAALQAGDVTIGQLMATSALRRRGSPLLRAAIQLMDARSESIFESLLRLLHVICGIDVEPQHVVVDHTGQRVARGDLLIVGTHMLHELDGGHHREAARQRRDLQRDRRLLGAGYLRRGFTSQDVLLQPVGIVRDAEQSLGVDHDPARLQRWYPLFQESLFTAAGQVRLAARLGLAAETADDISC